MIINAVLSQDICFIFYLQYDKILLFQNIAYVNSGLIKIIKTVSRCNVHFGYLIVHIIDFSQKTTDFIQSIICYLTSIQTLDTVSENPCGHFFFCFEYAFCHNILTAQNEQRRPGIMQRINLKKIDAVTTAFEAEQCMHIL